MGLWRDRTRYDLTDDGVAITRTRYGIWRTHHTIPFANVSDVQIIVQRHAKPGEARPIYQRSVALFRFVDGHGNEVGTIAGELDEPRQHEFVWLPHDAIDFSNVKTGSVVALAIAATRRIQQRSAYR